MTQPNQHASQLTHRPLPQSNAEKTTSASRKPLDWSKEIDVTTLTLPHMMAMTGGHGIVCGQFFAGGGNLSGLVRRITIMPNGAIRVIIERQASDYMVTTGSFGAFVFFGNGMYAEVDTLVHEDITIENAGPWQQSIAVAR